MSDESLSAYAGLAAEVAGLGAPRGKRIGITDLPPDIPDVTSFDGRAIAAPLKISHRPSGGPKLPFDIIDHGLGHDWYAEAEGYRRVGLWLLHLVLSGRDFAGLRLTHPRPHIRTLWAAPERL